MGSGMGFEYGYRFSVDDEIISRYGNWYRMYRRIPIFVFEARTNFVVKGKFYDDDGGGGGGGGGGADEKVIDSETFDLGVCEIFCNEEWLKVWLGTRLRDYCMSDDEIQEFAHKAVAFAKQRAADAQHDIRMIPIAVDINICTVQQEGELINATMDRAIKPEYLYPIYLCPWLETSRPKGIKCFDPYLLNFLRRLRTIEVEDISKGLSYMEECPICLRNPTIGSQISSLKCGHAFHYHCIARWLGDNDLCPMCRQQAHEAFSRWKN